MTICSSCNLLKLTFDQIAFRSPAQLMTRTVEPPAETLSSSCLPDDVRLGYCLMMENGGAHVPVGGLLLHGTTIGIKPAR